MICIAIPHTGSIDAKVVDWLLRAKQTVLMERSYSVCKGRNLLLNRFLKETSDEWLMYLDSDMYPASDAILDFVRKQKDEKQVLFVPGLTNRLKWNFSQSEDGCLMALKDYVINDEFECRPIKTFGGSGIFLRRDLVEKLPPNIWKESNDPRTSEDILFSYTLTQTFKLPAYVIWGAALHHIKGGFDMLKIVGK